MDEKKIEEINAQIVEKKAQIAEQDSMIKEADKLKAGCEKRKSSLKSELAALESKIAGDKEEFATEMYNNFHTFLRDIHSGKTAIPDSLTRVFIKRKKFERTYYCPIINLSRMYNIVKNNAGWNEDGECYISVSTGSNAQAQLEASFESAGITVITIEAPETGHKYVSPKYQNRYLYAYLYFINLGYSDSEALAEAIKFMSSLPQEADMSTALFEAQQKQNHAKEGD